MRLALILTLLAADALAQTGRVFDRACEVSSRRSSRGGVACASGFTVSNSFAFGSFATPAMESGSYLCRVASGGTAWECINSSGAAAGTLTQGSGSTYAGTFAGSVKALSDITDVKAPIWAHSGLGIFAGDFTVITTGFATTATDATLQYWIEAGNFAIRNEGPTPRARFGSGGLTAITGDSTRDQWSITTARKTGGTGHTIRINSNTGVSNTFTDDLPTGFTNIGFGSFFPLRGPMAWTYFVPRSLSDDEVRQIEMAWWGVTPQMTLTSSPNCIDNTGTSGQVDCFKANAGLSNTVTGMRTVRGFTNFVTSPLDVSAWTDIATPIVTVNTTAGPFSRMMQANEADTLNDDAAGAMEGKRTATAGTTLGRYVFSCYISSGTLSSARLRVDTDGTGSVNCDFTGLTSTFTRKTCAATITGVPTRINGEIYPGTTATDTGTIIISQCQLNQGMIAETPTMVSGAVGSSTQQLNFIGLPPIVNKGKLEAVFTPLHDPNSQWVDTADNIRLFDASLSTPGHIAFIIFGYQNAGDMLARVDVTELTIPAGTISLTPGQRYVASLEWSGSGTCTSKLRLNSCAGSVGACVATTQIGSSFTGACPAQIERVYLGERYNNVLSTSLNYDAFRIYR